MGQQRKLENGLRNWKDYMEFKMVEIENQNRIFRTWENSTYGKSIIYEGIVSLIDVFSTRQSVHLKCLISISISKYYKQERRMIFINKKKPEKKITIPMYIVRSLDLMNWLCSQGYRVLKVEDSESNPRFKVFLYRDTPEIRKSVSLYLSQKEV